MRSLSTRRSSGALTRAALIRNLAALGAVVVLAVPSIAAAVPTVKPVPPVGKIYNRLAVDWWQYATSLPAATNPLLDGTDCGAGQSGPVFFLVGLSGSGAVERDCTVRAGKLLFFPLINAVDVHVPGDRLDTEDLVYKDFLSFGFRADTLFASVDGAPVGNLNPATTPFRACAAPVRGCGPSSFSLTFPDPPNLFGVAAGTYAPAVQDGYYLLLFPLRPGRHTIKFGGTGNFAGPVIQDITYNLLVTR